MDTALTTNKDPISAAEKSTPPFGFGVQAEGSGEEGRKVAQHNETSINAANQNSTPSTKPSEAGCMCSASCTSLPPVGP